MAASIPGSLADGYSFDQRHTYPSLFEDASDMLHSSNLVYTLAELRTYNGVGEDLYARFREIYLRNRLLVSDALNIVRSNRDHIKTHVLQKN